LKGYSDGAKAGLAVADLGGTWETLRIGVKPYPACRYTHAAVDGILQLCREERFEPLDITRITVGLHRNGIALVGAPLQDKRRARTVVEGQFSMPFAAAVALQRGRFGWDDYDLLGQPLTDTLSDRVDVLHDPSLEGLRHPFGASLEVVAAGRTWQLRIPDPSGEPETFPSPEQAAQKFHALTDPVQGSANTDWLAVLTSLRAAPSVRQHLMRR